MGLFLFGGLFILSMCFRFKGEVFVWGFFVGVIFGGWIWSWVIKGYGLESVEYEGEEE